MGPAPPPLPPLRWSRARLARQALALAALAAAQLALVFLVAGGEDPDEADRATGDDGGVALSFRPRGAGGVGAGAESGGNGQGGEGEEGGSGSAPVDSGDTGIRPADWIVDGRAPERRGPRLSYRARTPRPLPPASPEEPTGAAEPVQDEEPLPAIVQVEDPGGTGLLARYRGYAEAHETAPADEVEPAFERRRLDPSVDLSRATGLEVELEEVGSLGVRWSGYVSVPSDSDYLFQLGINDGAVLALDNAVVIQASPATHAFGWRQAIVPLRAGFHVLALDYFHSGTAPVCRLWGAPRGEAAAPIPTSRLFPLGHAAVSHLPLVLRVEPERAKAGERIRLIGRNLGEPGQQLVRLGGVPALLVAAGPQLLEVEVPEGTDSGPLEVWVEGSVSPGLEFTVDGVFGLHGQYVDLEDEAHRFERIDGPLIFADGASFALPFPAASFRVRWRGELFVTRPDVHVFWVTADDEALLAVDGTQVLRVGPTPQAAERSAPVHLGLGWHSLELDYTQREDTAVLKLEYQEQMFGLRRAIPRGRLRPPPAIAEHPVPVVTALEPPEVAPGAQLTIHGEHLSSSTLAGPTVTIAGVVTPLELVSLDTLVLRVPLDATAGPVVVWLGPLASEPVALELLGDVEPPEGQ